MPLSNGDQEENDKVEERCHSHTAPPESSELTEAITQRLEEWAEQVAEYNGAVLDRQARVLHERDRRKALRAKWRKRRRGRTHRELPPDGDSVLEHESSTQ